MPRDTKLRHEHSPLAILTELAVEGTSTVIEAQRVLLNLAQQENEIIMNGVKERLAGSAPAMAMTDLARRSLDTLIGMQQDLLTTTGKQTLGWLEAVQAGKGYEGAHLADLAREGVKAFVHAQKKFLDALTQETARATSGKAEHAKPVKKTELSKLVRDAANSFIDAQKKLLDVLAQQMNVNADAATRTIEVLSPSRLLPVARLTGEGVKSFVDAEKALVKSVIRPRRQAKVVSILKHRRTVRQRKAA